MYDFFRRYNKSLMAFFGVILMIAFLMPTFQTGSRGAVDPVIGHVGTRPVHQNQVRQAEAEWDFLQRRLAYSPLSGSGAAGQWQSVAAQIPAPLAMLISENPTAYFLLQEEARQMGLSPQMATADRVLEMPNYGLVMADKRILPAQDVSDPMLQNMARTTIANLDMVLRAYQRASSVVKVSAPLIKHEVALRLQQIKVRLVDFQAKDYTDKVPAPTPEQLQQQFAAHKDVEAGTPTASNPFGFGYRYPNRVKLQYISIPRDEVLRVVKATKDDYGWEVEAQRYYIAHQADFPTTAPAATQESLALLPVRPAPTTRPFDEVRQQIMQRVLDPLVDRLQLQIQSEISSRLAQDYHTYQTARGPSTFPASAPAGMPYESFEFLQKLASDIQNRHKVTITIVAVADSFKSSEQLRELKDITNVTNFAELAVAVAEPFVAPEHRNQPAVLSLFEPSRALTDDSKNVYFFRLTAVDAAHAPASLEEVQEKVTADWKRARAFELAKEDAQKLLEAAKGPGLDAVASDKLITTGLYSASNFLPIENYRLSTTAQTIFTRETYDLLGRIGQPDAGRPITLVSMPGDERLAVAELIAVDSGVNEQTAALAQSFLSNQIIQQYESSLASGWFNYNSVLERTGYAPVNPQSAAAVP